jgi:hypothetical protein
VRCLNTSLSSVSRTSRQKINKKILELKNSMDKMDLIDIYKIFHPTADYTLLSAVHGTFFKIDHILGQGHKANLNKYKNNQNNPLYPNRT